MIALTVPGEIAYRELATRVIATACKLVRITTDNGRLRLVDEFTHQLGSAVGEAFNNVAIHGYENRPIGNIVIEVITHEDCLVIDIKDFGQSFHPDDAPALDLGALCESGMGIFIIRAFVDELTYTPGSPNCMRMVKRFESWGNVTAPHTKDMQ